MPIKVKFCGGVRTVTGSSHLVSTHRSNVLLDTGIFYGKRDEFYRVNTTFSYKPNKLDAVVISHAHIDHCGNLPSLIKRGLRCRAFTTTATRQLCQLMLADSGKIQEEDTKYVNKINRKLGLAARRPLYTQSEGIKAIKRFRGLNYGQKFKLTKDITLAFVDAGHILGSGITVLDIKEKNKIIRLVYAVDLGRKNLPIINDPVVPPEIDYLIIETTYGGRLHSGIEEGKIQFKDAINRTLERKGKVIIPSFALERSQEVIYFLNELIKEKAIPEVPIYLDSPLATDITEVFRNNIGYLDDEARRLMKEDKSPFDFVNLRYIRDQKQSKALNEDKRPMIIIAGSGMCEAGRVLHHLKNNISDSRNTILIVGYMAKDTLGDRIRRKEKLVKIFGMEYQLNADVETIDGFSAHADKNELLSYIKECNQLKKIFLVHGDEDQTQKFHDMLIQNGFPSYVPHKEEEVELE